MQDLHWFSLRSELMLPLIEPSSTVIDQDPDRVPGALNGVTPRAPLSLQNSVTCFAAAALIAALGDHRSCDQPQFRLEQRHFLHGFAVGVDSARSLMYWFLFMVFRFILRRDVSSLGISDFLFVVILGDAAQNSMIGGATSATDGMVLVATLVFWSFMLDFMSFRFPVIQRFTAAQRLCPVRDGKMLRRNMRREFITPSASSHNLRILAATNRIWR